MKKMILAILVSIGILTLFYFLSWWFTIGISISRWTFVLLILGIVCATPQLIGNWILYLSVNERVTPKRLPDDISVDVFITAYDEPHSLIRRTLVAAVEMRGQHRTWLLDDSRNPNLQLLAAQIGAGYLTRTDHKGAKAGNINAAMKHTNGDIIVVFDIDHVPDPAFLERTLDYFTDPKIGFVQVMLTFDNGKTSWTARAATESSFDYYNPTSKGADGLGSATLTGSNALIRREALNAIGGYKPGLAEDLATSINLHAAGWKSVYVAEPLAPGLAPPDLVAWFTQQFKWSRGVFELLLTEYPRLFNKLTWGQRVTYSVRMTYYWIGPVIAAHILMTILALLSGNMVVLMAFQDYLLHIVPLAVVSLIIRHFALSNWRNPKIPTGVLWRPISLIYATWPIYTMAWIMAVLRIPLRFKPTPKSASSKINPVWLLPQIFTFFLLIASAVLALIQFNRFPLVFLLFVVVQSFLQLIILVQWPALHRITPAGSET
jgi:cellulose synthase (UDP-forming)